ncbi:PHD finger protein MALE STERILITY 1-like [Hibiscus syriacus]|uniref:PHD finger protein MALE STERILITY 1-like n=1 Tax=Hibiscus syriacus TaxID=106335 RepID=UPI00192286C6|nr:PHD finger protein MALE STERILITY 1-like [Hibiscus syriacus]
MHGVFHSNGFAHLLRVNGGKMGSDRLTGDQVIEFWDRLCTGLQARKVSDTSKKRRLFNGVAYDHPCFGRWGYKFGRGCYGLNQPIYRKATEAIQGIPLRLLKKRRVQVAFESRRDAARAYIDDTGLLEFYIKSLGNHIVGNYLVRRCLNPVTKVLEYNIAWKIFPLSFKLWCTIISRNNEGIDEGLKKLMLPPYECTSLNENATLDELKQEVKSFREVHWRMRSLVVETVANMSVKGSVLVVR